MGRTSKLTSLDVAAKMVSDGQRIALGGVAVYQRPMAFAGELIRQGRRKLTLVGVVNSIEADLLIGAGAVSRIETSYVGLEKYGQARNFRRAVENGVLEAVDYPELLAWDRFRASQEGLPFWPCAFLGGSGVVKYNPDIIPFTCPVTSAMLWAVPPAAPDVVIVHAPMGDEYGNVAFNHPRMLPQSVDITLTRACDTVIVTVEKIVTAREIKQRPHLVEIPAFRTTHIVEAPFGAYPTAMAGLYDCDDAAFADYAKASASAGHFAAWLAQTVKAPAGPAAWPERFGMVRPSSPGNRETPA